jgi:hypothetical protein
MAKKLTHGEPREAGVFDVLAMREDVHYDPGLDSFRRAMQSAERIIREDPESIEAIGIVEELNARWPFHAQEITVSGKLYLAGDQEGIEEFIGDDWGPRKLDQWGDFYEVEDKTIISLGLIEAGVTADADSASSIVFAYGFDVEDDDPTFIARLQDVHKAEYPFSTYEASVAHLKHEYPAIFDDINRLVRPKTYDFNKLNNTLMYLIETYPSICSDTKLGAWVSMYLGRRVRFDQYSTYAFTVKGEMSLPDDDGDDETFIIDEPYLFDARILSIGFAELERLGNTSEPIACYLLALPSGITSAGEYLASQAIVPVGSVVDLESRRPKLSVMDQIRTAQRDKIRAGIARTGLVRLADQLSDDSGLNEEEEGVEAIPPTQIERWTDLQVRFASVITIVREARNVHYPTEESALVAAEELVGQINRLLHESESLYQTLLYVYGEGVQVPLVTTTTTPDQNGYTVTVHVNAEIQTPPISYETIGACESVCASGEQVDDYDFIPAVHMVLHKGHDYKKITMLTFETQPLASTSVTQSALVRLDGTSSIEVQGLNIIQRKKEILSNYNRLARERGTSEEAIVLNRLHEAIYREGQSESIPLKKINILHDVQQVMMKTSDIDSMAEALNMVIGSGRMLIISGDFLDKTGNKSSGSNCVVLCVNVAHTLPHSEERIPALVVTPTDVADTGSSTIHYVPLNSITKMQF